MDILDADLCAVQLTIISCQNTGFQFHKRTCRTHERSSGSSRSGPRRDWRGLRPARQSARCASLRTALQGIIPLSSNLSWTHSLQKLVRICGLLRAHIPGSYVRVEVSGCIIAVGLFRGSGKCQLLGDRLMSNNSPVSDPRTIAHGQDSCNGNRRPNRRCWAGGQPHFRERGGGRAPMSRGWFWSDCDSTTRMLLMRTFLTPSRGKSSRGSRRR